MKKNFKKVASILVVTCFVSLIGWNMTQETTNTIVSDVNLDNIEALGQEQSVYSCPGGACTYGGTTTTYPNGTIVNSGACSACCPSLKNPECGITGCRCK